MSVTVQAAGVDTWSPAWYVGLEGHSAAARAMEALATVRTKRGRMVPEPIDGHRIGWFPESGLLFAEGHPDPEGLASPASLPERLSALESALGDYGVQIDRRPSRHHWLEGQYGRYPGFAGIRRLDATVDLATESAAEGIAIMAGIAAVSRDAPGVKSHVWFGVAGHVETVEWKGHSGRKTLGRWYDKGVESGRDYRGRLLRPEDQRRWPAGARPVVEALTPAAVRGNLQRRFMSLWKASKGVTVAGPIILGQKLNDAIRAGDLSRTEAERIAGHLLLEAASAQGAPGEFSDGKNGGLSRATRYRRRARARDLGLVLADGLCQEVEVDLHQVLEAALEADAWDRQG